MGVMCQDNGSSDGAMVLRKLWKTRKARVPWKGLKPQHAGLMDPATIALETATGVCRIPVSGGSFPSLPAVELSQDSGTTVPCVPPGLSSTCQGDRLSPELCRAVLGPLFIVACWPQWLCRVSLLPLLGSEPAQASRTIRAVFS